MYKNTDDYKDLSELLESDKRAMAFYNSLSIPELRRVHRGGVEGFLTLYRGAAANADRRKPLMNTASANECTGCVPAGGDLTAEEWRSANGLTPAG